MSISTFIIPPTTPEPQPLNTSNGATTSNKKQKKIKGNAESDSTTAKIKSVEEKTTLSKGIEKLALGKKIRTPLKGDNATDVYMTKTVIFKPGKQAQIAKICYKLAKLMGAYGTVPRSKEGKASIASKKDVEKTYQILYSDTSSFLVEKKSSKEIPSAEAPLFSSKRLELLSSGEDDEKSFYLLPSNKIYEIRENDGKEYVKLEKDGFCYQLKEDDFGQINLVVPEQPLLQNKEKTADPYVLKINFSRLDQQDPEDPESPSEVLVPEESSFILNEKCVDTEQIDENIDNFDIKLKSGNFKVSRDEAGLYKISKQDGTKDTFSSLVSKTGETFLIAQKNIESIFEEKGLNFVKRKGERFYLENTQNKDIHVHRKHVDGLVQLKVQGIFTGSNTKPLDIRMDTPERAAFYQRIDKPSYIKAFVTTMIIRPQDGKITDLKESNVLFPILEGKENDPSAKLGVVLIDLDETFPESNTYSTLQEFTKGEDPTVHCVRNGLIGFPQARVPLTTEEKEKILEMIDPSVIHELLAKFTGEKGNLKEKQLNATDEILEKMVEFIETHKNEEWTLEQFFFAIFPEYKKQWEMLKDQPPEIKASFIGLHSESEFKKLLK